MKVETKKVISVQEWNKIVVKTYGRPYNFQQQDGCQDRGLVRITVPDEETYDFENVSIPEKLIECKDITCRHYAKCLEGEKPC